MPAPQSTCPSPVNLHMMLDDSVRHLCLVYVATEHGRLTFFECCAAFAAFCSCAVCSWAMACAVACNTATCCTAMLTLRATAASHSTSPALADLSSACMCALNDRAGGKILGKPAVCTVHGALCDAEGCRASLTFAARCKPYSQCLCFAYIS